MRQLHILLENTCSQLLSTVQVTFIGVSEHLIIPVLPQVVFDHQYLLKLLHPHSFQKLLFIILSTDTILHVAFEYWCLILLLIQAEVIHMTCPIGCINHKNLLEL